MRLIGLPLINAIAVYRAADLFSAWRLNGTLILPELQAAIFKRQTEIFEQRPDFSSGLSINSSWITRWTRPGNASSTCRI